MARCTGLKVEVEKDSWPHPRDVLQQEADSSPRTMGSQELCTPAASTSQSSYGFGGWELACIVQGVQAPDKPGGGSEQSLRFSRKNEADCGGQI